VVPDSHSFAFHVLASSDAYPRASIIEESSLFDGIIKPTWHKYALQMALKLLVARYVTTKYYVTLDADIVVVGCLDIAQLLPGGKGVHDPVIICFVKHVSTSLGSPQNHNMSIRTGGKAPL